VSAEVELYYDFSSPFAYLGFERLFPVARAAGARVALRPFLLGGLFKAVGQVDVPFLAMPPAKQRHVLRDLERWAEVAGVPYAFPSRFPITTVKPLRLVLAAPEGEREALSRAFFRAYWGGAGRDLSSDDELGQIVAEAGLEPSMVARAGEPMWREALRAATAQAAERGVFGAPTFVVGEHLVWGQDRLDFVERMLGGWKPRGG
jgi:2-hydroxychromene-2-carboxylate isomerase